MGTMSQNTTFVGEISFLKKKSKIKSFPLGFLLYPRLVPKSQSSSVYLASHLTPYLATN